MTHHFKFPLQDLDGQGTQYPRHGCGIVCAFPKMLWKCHFLKSGLGSHQGLYRKVLNGPSAKATTEGYSSCAHLHCGTHRMWEEELGAQKKKKRKKGTNCPNLASMFLQ